MASCKECVHVEVCKDYIKTVLGDFDDSQMCGDDCEFFRDRSRFVELPFGVGDTFYEVVHDYGEPEPKVEEHYIDEINTNGGVWYVDKAKKCHINAFSGWERYKTREEAENALKEREENG